MEMQCQMRGDAAHSKLEENAHMNDKGMQTETTGDGCDTMCYSVQAGNGTASSLEAH